MNELSDGRGIGDLQAAPQARRYAAWDESKPDFANQGLHTGSSSQISDRLRPARGDSHSAEFEGRAPGITERKWDHEENLPVTLQARVTQQSYDLITGIFSSAPDRCSAALRSMASI